VRMQKNRSQRLPKRSGGTTCGDHRLDRGRWCQSSASVSDSVGEIGRCARYGRDSPVLGGRQTSSPGDQFISNYCSLGLTLAIIVYSAGAFLTSSYSAKIRGSLAIANPLAVKLIDELGPASSTNELVCQKRALPIEFVQECRDLRCSSGAEW